MQGRKEQVRYAIERGLSQRRACTLFNISRSNLAYRAKMPGKEGPVLQAMKDLSGRHPRFGARRIKELLKRKEIVLGKARCARLWAKAGLQVPRKRSRKLLRKREHLPIPTGKNSVWSYDFV